MTREPDDIAYEREADVVAEVEHAYRRQVERINAYVRRCVTCRDGEQVEGGQCVACCEKRDRRERESA